MKIIICGPAHSGKSVFVANLRRFLPREGSFLFRCAPDGEGTWSNKADQELVSKIRRKGKFDSTFMDYVLGGLENCRIPITLVDVGGIRSKENEEIFAKCDAFIVLSSKDEELGEWQRFGESLGLRCLALLRSRLTGSEEIENVQADAPIAGTICGLERGIEIESELLRHVAQRLIIMTARELAAYKEEEEMNTETKKTVKIVAIAAAISKENETYPLPNGKVVTGLNWRGDDLPAVDAHMRSLTFGRNTHFVVDGACPAWLALAVVHGGHPASASLNDPRLGVVPVGCELPGDPHGGKNLTFETEEKEAYTLVNFEVAGGTFDVADLASVVPPTVNTKKAVVISGRGPNWLVVSIAMAYHAAAAAVYCFQPDVGATCAMTHHPEHQLGSLIQIEV